MMQTVILIIPIGMRSIHGMCARVCLCIIGQFAFIFNLSLTRVIDWIGSAHAGSAEEYKSGNDEGWARVVASL